MSKALFYGYTRTGAPRRRRRSSASAPAPSTSARQHFSGSSAARSAPAPSSGLRAILAGATSPQPAGGQSTLPHSAIRALSPSLRYVAQRREHRRQQRPEVVELLAQRRAGRLWRKARAESGLQGPAPTVEIHPDSANARLAHTHVGEPTVHLSAELARALGGTRKPARQKAKGILLHEFAHTGQRAPSVPGAASAIGMTRQTPSPDLPIEGGAEMFRRMMTRRLGIPRSPRAPADYEDYRGQFRAGLRNPRRYGLWGQFE